MREICTQPDGIRLVVVKVEASEQDLYGLGCATFTRRPMPVANAVNDYIDPFCADEVELLHDIHERIHPVEAINLIKAVQQYRPFSIEDPFAPEDVSPVGHAANAHIDLTVWN